ncbi:MAG: hypothetical protein WBB74_04015, partial [Gaiellaceae bacterium]
MAPAKAGMDEGNGHELQPGRRHIIERPRLTRLLDRATARIRMLVAPAGYGKTTLAQQWLRDKPHSWYRGSLASADVAALAIGLGEAASAVLPGACDRVRERLRATNNPESEVNVLAELLAEDLAAWPEGTWLVFDDYHFAGESRAAEEFVDVLL